MMKKSKGELLKLKKIQYLKFKKLLDILIADQTMTKKRSVYLRAEIINTKNRWEKALSDLGF